MEELIKRKPKYMDDIFKMSMKLLLNKNCNNICINHTLAPTKEVLSSKYNSLVLCCAPSKEVSNCLICTAPIIDSGLMWLFVSSSVIGPTGVSLNE